MGDSIGHGQGMGTATIVQLIAKFEAYNGRYEAIYVTAELRPIQCDRCGGLSALHCAKCEGRGTVERWFPCISGEPFGNPEGYDSLENATGAWESENERAAERRAAVFG
jgi:hypothetical protein